MHSASSGSRTSGPFNYSLTSRDCLDDKMDLDEGLNHLAIESFDRSMGKARQRRAPTGDPSGCSKSQSVPVEDVSHQGNIPPSELIKIQGRGEEDHWRASVDFAELGAEVEED